ncbi:single-strand DNA-binding protein [Lactobacillus colini]|uniref:Single-stranded DNA-binding protein n=1 Tax=Lactobacillus colini TaxID=1819254 RepID=A0ABS4MHT4_9LACO|nr:single-stranded DNA-binding protein [Lactobacillus colini]MBP2058906.1 single-strand DNA-binding protein [Lactobacillus colini]
MINNVVLVGRLTRDPDLRSTGSGISVASFTLAVDRNYSNKQGQREADFINCVIWRKGAEVFSNYTSKGSLVGIQGRLQTRTYEDKDGKTVYVTEVVVNDFSFLDTRRRNDADQANGGSFAPQAPSAPNTNNFGGMSAPSGNNNAAPAPNNEDPFKDSGSTIEISDNDLPF